MTRALVLGGGGVTGIAWETGVLNGLLDAEIDLDVDAVFGTSAGSFVGAALAAGTDLRELLAAQHRSAPGEFDSVRLPRTLFAAWVLAYLRGWGNPARIGAGFGAIARRRRPLLTEARSRQAARSRMTVDDFPPRLQVTAVDAETGELRAFSREDGYPLVDVLSASGAVPGITPGVVLGDRTWIDGGMVSSANAMLATGFHDVLVIAPLPKSYAGIPPVARDVATLGEAANAHLITPDSESRRAIGNNIYDTDRRAACADAGRAQGRAAAAALGTAWRRPRRQAHRAAGAL